MKNRLFPLVIVVLSFSLGIVACGGSSDGGSTVALSPEAQAGKTAFNSGCLGCHTINGARGAGPSVKGLSGSMVELADGTTVTADDAYLLKAIVNPGAELVRGYSNSMTSAYPPGSVSEEEAKNIVAYIKILK